MKATVSSGWGLAVHDRVAQRTFWFGVGVFVLFWVASVARAFLGDLPSGIEHGSVGGAALASLTSSWLAVVPGVVYGWRRGLWATDTGRRSEGHGAESRLSAVLWALLFTAAGVRLLLQGDVLLAVLTPPATVLCFAAGAAVGRVASISTPSSRSSGGSGVEPPDLSDPTNDSAGS